MRSPRIDPTTAQYWPLRTIALSTQVLSTSDAMPATGAVLYVEEQSLTHCWPNRPLRGGGVAKHPQRRQKRQKKKRRQAPPPPGVVKQDKSSGGSVDTTKTRSGHRGSE